MIQSAMRSKALVTASGTAEEERGIGRPQRHFVTPPRRNPWRVLAGAETEETVS
jgi:hypothetical protein